MKTKLFLMCTPCAAVLLLHVWLLYGTGSIHTYSLHAFLRKCQLLKMRSLRAEGSSCPGVGTIQAMEKHVLETAEKTIKEL